MLHWLPGNSSDAHRRGLHRGMDVWGCGSFEKGTVLGTPYHRQCRYKVGSLWFSCVLYELPHVAFSPWHHVHLGIMPVVLCPWHPGNSTRQDSFIVLAMVIQINVLCLDMQFTCSPSPRQIFACLLLLVLEKACVWGAVRKDRDEARKNGFGEKNEVW